MKKNSTETDEINFDIRLTWEEKQRRKQLTAERKFEKILKIPLWCVSWNFTRYCPTKGSPHPKNYLAYSDLLVLIVQYFNDVFRNPDFCNVFRRDPVVRFPSGATHFALGLPYCIFEIFLTSRAKLANPTRKNKRTFF